MARVAVLTANRSRTMRDLEASGSAESISHSTGRAKLKNGDEQFVISTPQQLMGLTIDSFWVSGSDVPQELIDLANSRTIQGGTEQPAE